MQLTGGEALARQLVLEGVTDLFGIPGVQLDWAVDGLRQVGNHIRYVVPRHEQAASFMADGYARTTGRIGTCMVVPGPGLLNAMAGLATAYACNSPVLSFPMPKERGGGTNGARPIDDRTEIDGESYGPQFLAVSIRGSSLLAARFRGRPNAVAP